MRMQFTNLMGALVLAGTASMFASCAIAQEAELTPVVVPASANTPSIPEAFDRAATRSSGNVYTNVTFRRQLELILGFGTSSLNSFADNEALRDARRVEILYKEVLEQQSASDPVLRTPDLANPFNTTLRSLRSNNGISGSEFIVEPSVR
jgi:hypothetical protein